MHALPRLARSVWLVSLALLALLAGPPPGGVRGDDKAIGSLEAVGTLINASSSARQIVESGNPDATAKHAEAREIYQRAHEAHRTGASEESGRLLSEAVAKMQEAARLAGAESVTSVKLRRDFLARLDTVNSLTKAYERIAGEKRKDSAKVANEIDGRVTRARSLFDASRLTEARTELDEAYATARSAVEQLREGDTLVKKLEFDSKEEEYRYELDRNDTHRMLMGSLLKDKSDTPSVAQMARPLLDRAEELRRQAEAAAAAAEFERAISLLEESTTQLTRAIRAAGIYIPG